MYLSYLTILPFVLSEKYLGKVTHLFPTVAIKSPVLNFRGRSEEGDNTQFKVF